MELKHKCVRLPLPSRTEGNFASNLSEAITSWNPEWGVIRMRNPAPYLGVTIGPQAGTQSWDNVIEVWQKKGRGAYGSKARGELHHPVIQLSGCTCRVLHRAAPAHPKSLRGIEDVMNARLLRHGPIACPRAPTCI